MRRPDNASVTNQEARQVFRRTWLGIWYRRNYTAPMIITGYFSSVRQQLYTLIFSLSVRRSTEVISDHCLLLTACARCLVTLLSSAVIYWCSLQSALCPAHCYLTAHNATQTKTDWTGNEFGVFYAKYSIFPARLFSCGVHGDLDVYSCLEWIVSGDLGLGRFGQGSNIKEMLMFCFELRLSQHHNSWALIIKKQWRVFKLYQKIYRIFYI